MVETKPANEILVQQFRHTLMWPVLLRGQPEHDGEDETFLEPWITTLKGTTPWEEPAEANPVGVHLDFDYTQIVYFHPFARDFLFGDGDTPLKYRTMRILRRRDVQSVRVRLGKWNTAQTVLDLNVHRAELYLCKPGVAILVVEVTELKRADNEPVTLDVLQDFTDQFRRLYPPFWWDADQGDQANEPGLCLQQLEWRDQENKPIPIGDSLHSEDVRDGQPIYHLHATKAEWDQFTRAGGEPPLFAHWQWLFGPKIRPARTQKNIRPYDGSNPEGLNIQQLVDERMPVMSYIAVENPEEVSQGDRDRLTFVDASGTDDFPYQKQFLDDHRDRHSYERFAHYQTHFFCSGYGLAMLGQGSDFFYSKILPNHFSHHYFCLGLIAHYQRAALLYFADELANSVKDLAGKPIRDELSSPEFREHVEEIQHRFLKFRSRAYFTEVTNQLQGKELFNLWFGVLETQQLFEQVDSSSERLTSVLAERESRQLAHTANELTDIANAFLPLLVGLTVAATGLAISGSLNMTNWDLWPSSTFWMIMLTFLISLISIGAFAWTKRKLKRLYSHHCNND